MALCWLISVVELTTVTEGDGDCCVVMGWIEDRKYRLEKSEIENDTWYLVLVPGTSTGSSNDEARTTSTPHHILCCEYQY